MSREEGYKNGFAAGSSAESKKWEAAHTAALATAREGWHSQAEMEAAVATARAEGWAAGYKTGDTFGQRDALAGAVVQDLAAALALMLYDAHPTYANTTGWRGGIGGAAMTPGCSIIDPPPNALWTQYDLLSAPLRAYLDASPGFDLEAAKERVKAAALAALRGDTDDA